MTVNGDFSGILIASEDPAAPTAYHAKLFGEPGWDGGYTGWLIGGGSVTIGPHSEVHGRNAAPGRLIWNIETPDVKGELARLKAAGAIVIREPYSFEMAPSAFIATLADPDDNDFQLMGPMGLAAGA